MYLLLILAVNPAQRVMAEVLVVGVSCRACHNVYIIRMTFDLSFSKGKKDVPELSLDLVIVNTIDGSTQDQPRTPGQYKSVSMHLYIKFYMFNNRMSLCTASTSTSMSNLFLRMAEMTSDLGH